MATIITHASPDLDALSSVWLVRRYMPGFADAEVRYEAKTGDGKKSDADPQVLYVDTGMGKFDHHQLPARLSAAKIIYDYLILHDYVPQYDIDALARMVDVITDYDNFAEVNYPVANADYFDFTLDKIIRGVNHTNKDDASKTDLILPLLDGILQVMKNKLKAEKNIKEGHIVHTKGYGKAIVLYNSNSDSVKFAQKAGYDLVAFKDSKRGHTRIVCVPKDEYDLTEVYEKVLQRDKVGSWYFHQSKHMIINGSDVSVATTISPLQPADLVAILESV